MNCSAKFMVCCNKFCLCLVDVNALRNGVSHPERRFPVLCNVLKMRKTAVERIAASEQSSGNPRSHAAAVMWSPGEANEISSVRKYKVQRGSKPAPHLTLLFSFPSWVFPQHSKAH
jgi:hypothetical protein